MVQLLAELRHGHCQGVKVRLGRLQNLVASACTEHLDLLPGCQQDSALDLQPLQQLGQVYSGYHSLTDLPRGVEVVEEVHHLAEQYQVLPVARVVQCAQDLGSRHLVEVLADLGTARLYAAIQVELAFCMLPAKYFHLCTPSTKVMVLIFFKMQSGF